MASTAGLLRFKGSRLGRFPSDGLAPAAAGKRRPHAANQTPELAKKSPNTVLGDAIMDDAVKGAISGIFAASGQTCIAGSRLLVQRSMHNEFVDRLMAFAKTARMGDPADPETQVGPVTTPRQCRKIPDYIAIGKTEGAQVALGGGPADRTRSGEGWLVDPTIFTGVNNRMRIAQEEIFGPVLSVIPFADEEEAIAIANDAVYGLAACVWTQSMRRALLMSERLRDGTIWINVPRGPFHVGVRRLQAKRA